MFHILYGQDYFHRDKALEEIKKGLGDPGMLALNTSLFNGKELTMNQLKDACSAVPFMCPARLVVVEGLLERFESKRNEERRADSTRKEGGSKLKEWQVLADYARQMPVTTELVLMDADLNKRGKNPLLKSLSPVAKVTHFRKLQGEKLGSWIREHVKQEGGTISPRAISLLMDLVGGDLWAMNSEIRKLLTYGSGQNITEDDVKQVTSYANEAVIFDFVDAIIEGKTKDAHDRLHKLFWGGASPLYVLDMVTRQLRLIILAKEMGPRIFRSDIRNTLERQPIKDFPLQKALKQAQAWQFEQIRRAYHKLLEADVAIKTGKYEGDLALDILVQELCQR